MLLEDGLSDPLPLFSFSFLSRLLSGAGSHTFMKRITNQKWETTQENPVSTVPICAQLLSPFDSQEMGKYLFHSNFQSRLGVSERQNTVVSMREEVTLQRVRNGNFE